MHIVYCANANVQKYKIMKEELTETFFSDELLEMKLVLCKDSFHWLRKKVIHFWSEL
jgi:hypothetical protein